MKPGNFRAMCALTIGISVLASCNDGSEPVVPGSIELAVTAPQTAAAGAVVPISVRVLSTTGKPMAGQPVGFSSSANGTVTPTQQTTDAGGVANAAWTLPTQAGAHQLTASAGGVSLGIPTAVSAGAVAKATRGSPDGQTEVVTSTVGAAPIVRVTDAHDNPVAGATVTFTASHDGLVGAPNATTDANGLARSVTWVLGKTAGVQTLSASVAGAPLVTFTTTALAGSASELRVTRQPGSSARAGIPLLSAPIVQITDVWGNAVAVTGVPITAAIMGTPTLTNGTAVTDASGAATFQNLTLSGVEGNYTIQFTGGIYVPTNSHPLRLEGGVPTRLVVVTQPATTGGSGERLATQPIVEIHDAWNNRVLVAAHAVSAAVVGGTQTLTGTTSVTARDGRATFTDLIVTGTGDVQLRFSAFGLPEASSATFNVPAVVGCTGNRIALSYTLGQSTRFQANSPDAPACVDFTSANAGEQYVVLFENMTARGSYSNSLFPGVLSDEGGFPVSIASSNATPSTTSNSRMQAVPSGAVHSWDFGAGRIYEIEPKPPVGGVRPAAALRNQSMLDASASTSAVVVGDTISMYLEGIPRLNISAGNQRAVVRYVGPDLIIAEDVRLGELKRQSGGTNTPLTQADMNAIAADYAAYAKVQSDRFFGGRHNNATEASGSRPIAVHTLMPSDNIWGYTYPNGNYFAWDFWVATDGVTKGLNQHVQKNSDNLFMHEIAHMRHHGLLERANRSVRGNRWLVEGFARASERWPIAMRLLGSADFSRTGNVVLPANPAFERSSLEDVPVYTQTSVSLYDGYAAASYVFDYFADQVSSTTATPWMTALAEFVTYAGIENDLNGVIARYLPGVDFGTLLTRSRIAFFTDDYGAGLPGWTQYHSYQLRASRQTINPHLDPRNQWPRIVPGTAYADTREITRGASFGYVIDGTMSATPTRIRINAQNTPNGVISITRVK